MHHKHILDIARGKEKLIDSKNYVVLADIVRKESGGFKDQGGSATVLFARLPRRGSSQGRRKLG